MTPAKLPGRGEPRRAPRIVEAIAEAPVKDSDRSTVEIPAFSELEEGERPSSRPTSPSDPSQRVTVPTAPAARLLKRKRSKE